MRLLIFLFSLFLFYELIMINKSFKATYNFSISIFSLNLFVTKTCIVKLAKKLKLLQMQHLYNTLSPTHGPIIEKGERKSFEMKVRCSIDAPFCCRFKPTNITVCIFQSIKSPVKLNSFFSKFFFYIT